MLKQAHPARTKQTTGQYRPEIDGLRAIAILAVVAFHAGVPYTTGGFVGVDIFFVISGFLITGLLLRECEANGRIDIANFYARRARRLLPALIVVLAATLLLGWVYLTPIGEQQDLAKSALATASFVANIFFWRTQSGYFAGPAEQLPLLHMWTLAVEEQFYIVWPLAMLLIVFLARRLGYSMRLSLAVSLFTASIISLLACLWMTSINPTWAFYLTPFRGWEFGVGGLLAFLPSRSSGSSARTGAGLSIAGFIAILISIFWYSPYTLFPGYAAMLPVFGTGAIILGMSWAPGGVVTRLLETAPMVTIGKLSYSWYLWHWPLLAMARSVNLGERNLWLDIALVLAALLLSALSYRYVEQPVRQRKIWHGASSQWFVKAGLISIVLTMGLASLLWGNASYKLQNDKMLQALSTAKSQRISIPLQCTQFSLPFAGLGPIDDCMLGAKDKAPIILLWGDSHAFHYIPALTDITATDQVHLLPRVMGGCKPYVRGPVAALQANHASSATACTAFNKAVLDELHQYRAKGATTVILSAHWAKPAFWQKQLVPWRKDLQAVANQIRANGLKIILFADVPNYKWSIPNCIARYGIASCSRTREDALAQTAETNAILQSIAANTDGVEFWNPLDTICPAPKTPKSESTAYCLLVYNDTILYSDANHLSILGSRLFINSISNVLAKRSAAGETKQ